MLGVGCPVEGTAGSRTLSRGEGPGQGLFRRSPWDWRTGESVGVERGGVVLTTALG